MPNDELWRKALFIRRFEEKLLQLFQEGHLHGTVHTCIGQEWSAIAVAAALEERDLVFSNHRGHGHFIAGGGDPLRLLAEIMGRENGVCSGIGGSQHLCDDGFISNGIQGGLVPVAAGAALAQKISASKSIVIVFIGDGTLGQGVLYETLNIASKWDLPLMIVVENNGIAQTTFAADAVAGDVRGRAQAFDVEYRSGTTRRPDELIERVAEACDFVREASVPLVFEVSTDRLMPHSKSDDTRDPELIAELWAQDTLTIRHASGDLCLADENIRAELDSLVADAMTQPCIDAASLPRPSYPLQDAPVTWRRLDAGAAGGARLGERLNDFFHELMDRDDRVLMIGEDIEDPYGGAFKVTRGLSSRFPDRVRNTPISEAAIVGVGTGLAMMGYRPIVEIMFGDFLPLCLDQLLNQACKFAFMYDEQIRAPLVVRTPMGGYRGYGPTHSQCLEKHFLGIPYLTVAAPNYRLEPALVWEGLLEHVEHPLLVIENKVDYTRRIPEQPPIGYVVDITNAAVPTLRISPQGAQPHVTVACYGGTLPLVEEAIGVAFEEYEVVCEVVCPTLIHPTDIDAVADSVSYSGKLLTVEEGNSFASWSSELIAGLTERNVTLDAVARVSSDVFPPTCRNLEDAVLPQVSDIVGQLGKLREA